jgi:hypothetical protein
LKKLELRNMRLLVRFADWDLKNYRGKDVKKKWFLGCYRGFFAKRQLLAEF